MENLVRRVKRHQQKLSGTFCFHSDHKYCTSSLHCGILMSPISNFPQLYLGQCVSKCIHSSGKTWGLCCRALHSRKHLPPHLTLLPTRSVTHPVMTKPDVYRKNSMVARDRCITRPHFLCLDNKEPGEDLAIFYPYPCKKGNELLLAHRHTSSDWELPCPKLPQLCHQNTNESSWDTNSGEDSSAVEEPLKDL